MNRNIFPKSSNTLPIIIVMVIGVLAVGIIFQIWYWWSPKHLNVGYQPKQPIPYSHELHVNQLGIDCRYCHSEVEKGAHANIPSSELCLNCHSQIKTESPHIQKIQESFDKDEPIEWVNVHQLPDYAYFNHSRHVNAGVSCVDCHGRVDKMKEVYQAKPMSMGFCLDCHREPEKYIRPKKEVTNLAWKSDNQIELGKKLIKEYHINPREDCSACHR